MFSSGTKPLISIGMPVYNASSYIGDTIDSMLSQTFENFELIISDNASTDGTAEICKSKATLDRRIRYFQNKENIGMIKNFNQVFEYSEGEYFMWAGAHDFWDKNLLHHTVHKLIHNQNLVACFGEFHEITSNGDFLRVLPIDVDTQGLSPYQRLKKVAQNFDTGCAFLLYNLMRSEAMKKTKLFRYCYGFDFVFIAELSLWGEFCFVPEGKTFVRAFPQRVMSERENVIRLLGEKMAEEKVGKNMERFPYLQIFLNFANVVNLSNVSSVQKLKLMMKALRKLKKFVFREMATRWLPLSIRQTLKKVIKINHEPRYQA